MKKTILIFSCLIVTLLVLFQLSKYSYLSGNISIEIVIAVIAVTFLFIGIFLNKKSLQKKHIPKGEIDHQKIKQLDLSPREYEVLVEITKGLSNKEIGNKLFLSESTIKTHASQVLTKLNVKRRAQVIQKAQKLQIIAF